MPTATEPRITLRLDHRVHGALLDAAKQAKRKPATLARLLLEDALGVGAVEQALGSGTMADERHEDPASAEPSKPPWEKPRVSAAKLGVVPRPKP